MAKFKISPMLTFLAILILFSAPAGATIIDLNLTLSTGAASGFKIEGSTQEWLDVNTKEYEYDHDAGTVSGAIDDFRLATINEWWVIANELLSDGVYSWDEHKIIGGTYFDGTIPYWHAVGLTVPGGTSDGGDEGDVGAGIRYNDEGSVAWITDSWMSSMEAWMVRDVAPVPEPTTMLLLGLGLMGLAGMRRKMM